jgi:hypothetical protein
MPATTYRSADFMDAAHRLGADVVVGSDLPQILETFSDGRTVTLDFDHPERAVEQIRSVPAFDAIVPVDEEGTLLAATLANALKLPHNSIASVEAARNKAVSRRLFLDAGLPCRASRSWRWTRIPNRPPRASASPAWSNPSCSRRARA